MAPIREPVLRDVERLRLRRMVVNGTCEADWPEVRSLAQDHPMVFPCFGVHPWHVSTLSSRWRKTLLQCLDLGPCGVGEIGLDRWVKDYDLPLQEEVFTWQMRVASERNLPVTIHCLKAWGRLHEMLRRGPRPARGFLLHSYGGPEEMIQPLADLGAYFSMSGYFAHARKARQCAAFRSVPIDRLLIETDAPDMGPPAVWNDFPLTDERTGTAINHPGNIGAVHRFVAQLLDRPIEVLALRVEENFKHLFE